MSKHRHLPPIPAANHSQKGTGGNPCRGASQEGSHQSGRGGPDRKHRAKHNEQALFKGRRVKMIETCSAQGDKATEPIDADRG